MANGYLGKISAIVSANTADFDGKLSKSAKEVSSFARSVQSNLTSASRQAARSLEGIYTPLQKFERSLQAAASMKLSFKGFPGMIKDLDGLQQRLNSALSKRQVDIVLKTTGMSSVSALRDAISGLKSKDIELIARVGGIDKLKELGGKIETDVEIDAARKKLADLTAAAEAAKAKVTAIGSGAVTVKVNAESVDSLRAKLEATQAAAGKLMGGEYMGQKSLNKAISGVSDELVNVQAELARAVAAQKTLETMASGPRSKPEELSRANDRVSSLTGQRDERAKNLADLEKHRDDVRKVMREIKQAEAGGGVAASGGDIAAARKEEAAAVRAVSLATRDLQKQLSARFGVDIDITSLTALIEKANTAGGVINNLGELIENLGKSDFDAAADSMRKLQSASSQIFEPLAASVKKLAGLAVEFQAPFHDALKGTQADVERLKVAIDAVGDDGASPELLAFFDEVQAKSNGATKAIDRLVEVSGRLDQLKTGREFVFKQPGLNEAINNSAAIGSSAAGLPAETLRANPSIAQSLIDDRKLANEAVVAYAKYLNAVEQGVSTEAAQSGIDAVVKKWREAQGIVQAEIKVHVDSAEAQKKLDDLAERAQTRSFTLGSAAPQQRDLGLFGTPATRGAEEALGRARQLSAEFEKLPDAAKRSISGLAQIAGRLSNDLQSGKADASALNQVLDRLETSVRSLSAAEQQREAAAQARQRALAAEIAQNDRLITQERELAAARQADIAASRQQESASLDAAEQALIGPRRPAERPLNEVYGGLGQQAQEFRGAVESTFGLPQFDEFRDQARRAGAEIQSIKSEIQRLSTLDPQRDAAEYADAWSRVGTRVRAVSDMMAAGTRLAQTAAGGAPPGPPEIIDRNQDRLGAFSPMDRNAGNIGARTSLGGQGARTDISDMGRMSSLEDRRRQLARQAVGEDIEAPRRQLAALASSITSVKSQIDTLPDGVRTRFVPAIREAEAEFIRLSAAPNALPGAIDAARQRVQQLAADAARATQAMNFRQAFGGAGAAGLNLGLDQRALQGYNAQLQILQSAIGRASAEARGPAVAAFDRLRAAVATAFDEGNIDSGVQRDRLAAIRTEAIAAAASVSRIRVGSLTRDVARAGDIGRAGFDRFSLALNQAAFAVDDFMSSTGGIEFKLRAISNNITQLAFILGGTTGLFVGLGAVIAGQAAVGLIKWYNNGRTAEDQTKALNEALARQKSLVEELAQSFKALGDAMTRGTLSEGGQQARDFEDQVKSIRKKGTESREGRVFDLDRDVQRERAQQNAYKKQLESETDIGRRVVIARQIEQSKAAEREAMNRVRDRPEPTGADVAGLLERAAVRMEEAGRSQRPSDTEFPVANSIRRASDGLAVGDTPQAIRAQIRALGNATSSVSETSRQTFFGLPTRESATSSVAAAAFADMTERLNAKLEAAIEDLAINVIEASRGPAEQIRQAQEDVAEAIRKGVPNAAAFQRELDANAKKLKDAYTALESAQNETDLDKKQARVDEAQRNVAEVEGQQAAIGRRSREVRLGRTFGGERATAALSSLQGNERLGNESGGRTAQLVAAIDRELEARRKLESATAKGVDAEIKAAEAELELAQKASEAAAALAEAAAGIEAALTRIRKVGDSALQRSEQGADAAQRAFEENPLRAGGREARNAAEERLINDRATVGNAQADLDNRRRAVQQDPQMTAINGELEAITQRRKDLEAKSAIGGGLNQAENAELDAAAKREIELLRQREMMARQLTEAERKQLDAINNGILAREKELEKGRQRAAEDPTFKRSIDAANQIMADSERQANDAQQRYINNPNEKTRRERDEADARLRSDRQRAQELQDNLDNKRKEIERDPAVAANNKAIAANDKRLADLAEKEAKGGLTGLEIAERERIQGENRRMRGENEAAINAGTRDERKSIDDEQYTRNQRDRALRGRDLGLTDRERFRKEFTEGAGADINARAAEMRGRGENPAKFLRQAVANQMEAVSPMLYGFQEERQNAMLQGPSRAALNVSDVSTSQGASELTRLIRGDDSAKDVNLAELRKQTNKLDEVVKAIRDGNPGVLL